MEARAIARAVRVQPRKVRLVAAHVRGQNAIEAVNSLRFHTSKGAKVLEKVITSAVANAAANHGITAVETLTISEIRIDEGPKQKRIQARAMGRANRIEKKTSHILVVVSESDVKDAVKPHGTESKARPTFAKPKKKASKKAKTEEATTEAVEAAEVEETKAEETVTEDTAVEETVEEAATEESTEEAAAEEAPAESEEDKS
jgi:large subunit ribosomal protein L22